MRKFLLLENIVAIASGGKERAMSQERSGLAPAGRRGVTQASLPALISMLMMAAMLFAMGSALFPKPVPLQAARLRSLFPGTLCTSVFPCGKKIMVLVAIFDYTTCEVECMYAIIIQNILNNIAKDRNRSMSSDYFLV